MEGQVNWVNMKATRSSSVSLESVLQTADVCKLGNILDLGFFADEQPTQGSYQLG